MKEKNKSFSISADVELNAEGKKEVQSLMKELDEKDKEELRKVSKLLDSKLQDFADINSNFFTGIVEHNGKAGEELVQILKDLYLNALYIGWNTCYEYYKVKIEKV